MLFRAFFILLVSIVALSRCHNEKSGFCPELKPSSAGICANVCSGDSSCVGELKCCRTACGGSSCMEPVKPLPPTDTPTACPAINPGEAGICAFTCSGDGSCRQGQKCCPTACGGTACLDL